MTLSPCYRATCDAPGCTTAEMLPHGHATACREQLEAMGWSIFESRECVTGAPRLLYACPADRAWRPGSASRTVRRWESTRRAMIVWMLHSAAEQDRRRVTFGELADALGITTARVAEISHSFDSHIERRRRGSEYWNEPWAQRLRAAGAIP
jgi:hypothetical protein